MTYTNILEKLLFIGNTISTSWIYIGFASISILLILLLLFRKISKKTCFILVTMATKLLLGYTIYIYYEQISNLIDIIIDNIFLNIYFPSAYVYLFILCLINVSTIGNILKPRGGKVYKTVNGICFIITNFTLVLILECIAKNNIDVFKKESLFANTSLVTLLEFSINVFIIWLISLLGIYIINNITERIIISKENKKLVKEPAKVIDTKLVVEDNNEIVINKPVIEKPAYAIMPNANERKFIPNFTIDTINTEVASKDTLVIEEKSISAYTYDNTKFDLSSFIPKKTEVKPISIKQENNSKEILEQILNNELPVVKEPVAESFEEIKNTYTLNDYRIFNKMLKDIREHNGSSSITIDKMLEYRLITKYSTENYKMFKTMLKIYSN